MPAFIPLNPAIIILQPLSQYRASHAHAARSFRRCDCSSILIARVQGFIRRRLTPSAAILEFAIPLRSSNGPTSSTGNPSSSSCFPSSFALKLRLFPAKVFTGPHLLQAADSEVFYRASSLRRNYIRRNIRQTQLQVQGQRRSAPIRERRLLSVPTVMNPNNACVATNDRPDALTFPQTNLVQEMLPQPVHDLRRETEDMDHTASTIYITPAQQSSLSHNPAMTPPAMRSDAHLREGQPAIRMNARQLRNNHVTIPTGSLRRNCNRRNLRQTQLQLQHHRRSERIRERRFVSVPTVMIPNTAYETINDCPPTLSFPQNHLDEGTSTEVRLPATHPSTHNPCAKNCYPATRVPKLHFLRPSACPYCHAKLFHKATSALCCSRGRVDVNHIPESTELLNLFIEQSTTAHTFRQHIRAYNHIFSFTSLGVTLSERIPTANRGVYTFRAHDTMYHQISSLLHAPGSRPRYLQMFIYYIEHELNNRLSENSGLNAGLIERITDILNTINPFVQIFKQLASHPNIQQCMLLIKERPSVERQYSLPTASQVAAILVGGEDFMEANERDIIVETTDGYLMPINEYSRYYNRLQYPLLLPYGTYGWCGDKRIPRTERISCCDYYAYLLQIRGITPSILLHSGRLLHQYVIDNYIKIETQKLRWIRWLIATRKWVRRARARKVVGWLYVVSPAEGERFSFRLLLNHIPGPKSFVHLRTVSGRECTTFKAATELLGLLEEDSSIFNCLEEARGFKMPSALRRLFATILLYCEPIDVRTLWDDNFSVMIEDYTNMLDFANISSLIEDKLSILVSIADLTTVNNLNDGQLAVFHIISDYMRQKKSAIFFVDGPGGTSKTFLYRALLSTFRHEGNIVLATASSGIASNLLPGGGTAHSKLEIPINLIKNIFAMCFREGASAIIWDEAPMVHQKAFEAVDRTFRDVLSNEKSFGGKMVILGGDFRQVMPVVVNGTKLRIIRVSIIESFLWSDVHLLRLTDNMRARSDV
ncbi:hypothetical protein KSP39_PZI005379 [Platanthera zijinensis]|uniref:ATP-dependent DNA helicase n=1 Tax=Platanthera zijinensis TaxID=2320716 RepID=A0AAP0GAT0_9ASPA